MPSTYLSLSFPPPSAPPLLPFPLFSYLRNPLASGRASEFLATFHVLSFFSPSFVRGTTWTDVIGNLSSPPLPLIYDGKISSVQWLSVCHSVLNLSPGESWFLCSVQMNGKARGHLLIVSILADIGEESSMHAKQCRFKKFIGTRFALLSFRLVCRTLTLVTRKFFSFPISFRFLSPSIYIPNLYALHTYSTRIDREYKTCFKNHYTLHSSCIFEYNYISQPL